MLAAAAHAPVGPAVTDFDVVVVGAGPAGGSAALALAGQSASVLLLDRARFPRWKVCGACLSPGALSVLEELGVGGLPALLGAVPLERLTLRSRAGTVRVDLHGSKCLSRAALDLALARAAERAGAVFWAGARAELRRSERGGRVLTVVRGGEAVEVTARVVVDATGLGRGLAQGGGRASDPAPGARVGLGNEIDDRAYPVERGELHMAVGRAGYVGLVRVESGALAAAAAVDPGGLGGQAPHDLVCDLLVEAGLPPLSDVSRDSWKGTPSLMRVAGEVGAERLLRVGDAAGYVEPFTGEGIGWALADGRAAAALALRGVEGWRAEHLAEWLLYRRGHRKRVERLCRALAWGLRRPAVVAAVVASLRVAPSLAGPFVRRAARAPESLVRASA